MDIAVLGMGRMGRALAGRLLDSEHNITIWNRSPGKAPELLDRGAREARSIAEALDGVELVVTSLANDDAVDEVALGDGGVKSALPADATYVDASTVAPGTTGALGRAFSRYVAMPILGSPPQVASGEAIYLIGAENGNGDAVGPLFPHLSEKQFRYERPAMAAAAKLTVNLMLLNGVVALSEAFADGRAGGLSDDQLRELLGNSPMVAPGLKYRFEGILTGQQEPFWTTRLGAKDARLAVELAEAAGVDLPLTGTARRMYEQAATRSDSADIASVAELYRQPDRNH